MWKKGDLFKVEYSSVNEQHFQQEYKAIYNEVYEREASLLDQVGETKLLESGISVTQAKDELRNEINKERDIACQQATEMFMHDRANRTLLRKLVDAMPTVGMSVLAAKSPILAGVLKVVGFVLPQNKW